MGELIYVKLQNVLTPYDIETICVDYSIKRKIQYWLRVCSLFHPQCDCPFLSLELNKPLSRAIFEAGLPKKKNRKDGCLSFVRPRSISREKPAELISRKSLRFMRGGEMLFILLLLSRGGEGRHFILIYFSIILIVKTIKACVNFY